MVLPGSAKLGRSFMNMRNRGSNKEPWGTPEQTPDQDEDAPSVN